mmetsp:Transcript_14262/g.27834  ORF Transcript_14262/g.27834 Transcript_14262/m.27834 type:complete len:247 (-) Transcript_14262:521-1261(-)
MKSLFISAKWIKSGQHLTNSSTPTSERWHSSMLSRLRREKLGASIAASPSRSQLAWCSRSSSSQRQPAAMAARPDSLMRCERRSFSPPRLSVSETRRTDELAMAFAVASVQTKLPKLRSRSIEQALTTAIAPRSLIAGRLSAGTLGLMRSSCSRGQWSAMVYMAALLSSRLWQRSRLVRSGQQLVSAATTASEMLLLVVCSCVSCGQPLATANNASLLTLWHGARFRCVRERHSRARTRISASPGP